MFRKQMIGLAVTLALAAGTTSALAQSTAFTYQGQLKNSGTVVTTPTDIEYALFDDAFGGNQVSATITRLGETVTDGLFTSEVDFGSFPFTTNQPLYLQISVRNPAGVGAYVPMGSRQLLTAASYSLATRGINVSSDNQVGIGTTAQRSLLHVVGTGFFTDIDVPYGIFETAPDPSSSNRFGPQVRLKHGGPGGQEWVMVSGGAGNGPAGAFQLVREGASSAAFAADTTGWAGIGRSSSITGLGTEAFGVATKAGNTGYNGMIVDSAATNGLPYYGYSVGGQLKGWTTVSNAGQMEFWNNGSLNITVAPTGNVGLGVFPQARLHNPGSTRLDGVVQFGSTLQNGNTMTMQRLDGIANQSGFVFNIAPASSPNLASFNIYRNGASVYYLQLDGTASKPGGGAWAALCDERTKIDIQPLTGTLDRLLKLKGHSYSYKSEFVEKGRALPGTQIGLVAQEVETIFPDWVTMGADGMKQVTERSTTALMVEALRDLRTEKDAELATLKARLEKLESLIRDQNAVAAK